MFIIVGFFALSCVALTVARKNSQEEREHDPNPSVYDDTNISRFAQLASDEQLEWARRASYLSDDVELNDTSAKRVARCMDTVASSVADGTAEAVLLNTTAGQAFEFCSRKDIREHPNDAHVTLSPDSPVRLYLYAKPDVRLGILRQAANRTKEVAVDMDNVDSLVRLDHCIGNFSEVAHTDESIDQLKIVDQYGYCAVFEESGDLSEEGVPIIDKDTGKKRKRRRRRPK